MSDRVARLLEEMTVEEAVALLAGATLWETVAIPRLGIPAVRVIDGPSGARGKEFLAHPSLNVPAESALGATWDPDLVGRIGSLLGRQVRAKGARVHLAPTLNLHRTPVGGRNFEAFSEDPWLAATLAKAYVEGVQSEGAASCVKHFVGNDTEFERTTIDSRIDEATLREVYLRPFEAAAVDAGAGAVMASYNGVNGTAVTENAALLQRVLRDDWSFKGPVFSDWWGTRSTVEALVAGTDLEMPGPTAQRGAKLVDAVEQGLVDRATVTGATERLLRLFDEIGALDDGGPAPDRTLDTGEDRATLQETAASAMVLLRNEPVDGEPVLPLDASRPRRLAVVGPNAARGQFNGGGSAIVRPTRSSHPLDALTSRLVGWEIVHADGCSIDRRRPPIDPRRCTDPRAELFADPDGAADPQTEPDRVVPVDTTRLLWFDDPFQEGRTPRFSARFRTTFTADRGGLWTFGMTSVGDASMYVDGRLVLDNSDLETPEIAAMGKPEVSTSLDLGEGDSFELAACLRRIGDGDGLSALLIGCTPPPVEDPIAEAVEAARSADVSVVIAGTNGDWETEGRDREDLDLPGDQDALIRAVAAVSRRTIVVINAGSPVAMPWLEEVDAVMVAWFAGQALGDAMVDVLTGETEPQGRLPMTFPRAIEDTPAFEHHPGRGGIAEYGEGRLIGHRWFDTNDVDPLFPFGFGLGYALTEVASTELVGSHEVGVTVRNPTARDGVAVVQVYAHMPDRTGLRSDEPAQRLVGFAKLEVPAGDEVSAVVGLDPRAYQHWDEDGHGWFDHRRPVELRVGTSSRSVAARLQVLPDSR